MFNNLPKASEHFLYQKNRKNISMQVGPVVESIKKSDVVI